MADRVSPPKPAPVLQAADGVDDNDPKPTQKQLELLGLTGLNGFKTDLLGDVIDTKTPTEVDSAVELLQLADAVNAVMAAANGATGPSLEQLERLGLDDLNPANLAAVQQAIRSTADDGSGVDSLDKLQDLVDSVNEAFSAIADAAQSNSATETRPSALDYAKAGVTGVEAANLAALNSALNSAAVDGGAVDTAGEIQALVDAYKVIPVHKLKGWDFGTGLAVQDWLQCRKI
jgi:hypothetical protein